MEQNRNKSDILFIKETFCKRLRELRKENRYTQKETAQKMEIPVSTYANWELGRTEPSIYDIYNILCVLDISANDLFDKNIFKNNEGSQNL